MRKFSRRKRSIAVAIVLIAISAANIVVRLLYLARGEQNLIPFLAAVALLVLALALPSMKAFIRRQKRHRET